MDWDLEEGFVDSESASEMLDVSPKWVCEMASKEYFKGAFKRPRVGSIVPCWVIPKAAVELYARYRKLGRPTRAEAAGQMRLFANDEV